MSEIDPEKWVHAVKIAGQDRVVHAAEADGAAGHNKAVLHPIDHSAGQLLGEAGVADVEKAVSAAAVSENRDVALCAQQAGGEKHGVGAAGDVDGAVGVLLYGLAQGAQGGLSVKDLRLDVDQLRCEAPVGVKGRELRPRALVGVGRVGADIHHPAGTEDLRPQDVLQRPLVIQLDQSLQCRASLPVWQQVWFMGYGRRAAFCGFIIIYWLEKCKGGQK